MNIAVQFRGNPRSFKRCYESLRQNIFEQLNPDIFIHTWRQHGAERSDVTTDGAPEEYIDLYKPVAYQIDDLYYNFEMLQTMRPYFTSLYLSNELRKNYEIQNKKKYDVIICVRSDLTLTSPFKIEYAKMVTENSLWIRHFERIHFNLPCDYFFYTSPKWMDVSANCFHEMDKLNIHQPGGERLWWYKLQKEGFKYEWVNFFNDTINNDKEHEGRVFNFFDIHCIR
jgi:hypothetical protein